MGVPSRRSRMRPYELLGIAGVLSVFAGLIVLMSTRDLLLSLIALGVSFVVSLVVLAMIALSVNPPVDAEHPDDPGDPHGSQAK